LYRRLKIKTTIVLLAWTVIFLHGVIPHKHLQERSVGCSSIYHVINDDLQSSTDNHAINGKHDHNEKICHFSELLYSSQNWGDLNLTPVNELKILPVFVSEQYFPDRDDRAISLYKTCSSRLRAPPLS